MCVSSSPEERGRVAAALDGQAVLVIVADAQTAIDVLTRAAAQADPRTADEHVVRLGRLEIDRRRATVTWAGLPVDVSHLELEVLACLAASPGVVWSHEELHEAAWGTRYVGDRDSVYSLVKRLRRKLTERGVASTSSPCGASGSSWCPTWCARPRRSTRLGSRGGRATPEPA